MEGILAFLAPLLESFAGKYGWVVQVITIIGAARVVMKPLVETIKAVTASTKSTKDDEVVAKVEASSIYKGIVFVLDWLTSIKLPK